MAADLDRAILRMTVDAAVPFRIVDNPYFRELFQLLQPSYQIPGRYKLINTTLVHEYAAVVLEIQQYLELKPDFSLTYSLDGWEDNKGEVSMLISLWNGET